MSLAEVGCDPAGEGGGGGEGCLLVTGEDGEGGGALQVRPGQCAPGQTSPVRGGGAEGGAGQEVGGDDQGPESRQPTVTGPSVVLQSDALQVDQLRESGSVQVRQVVILINNFGLFGQV